MPLWVEVSPYRLLCKQKRKPQGSKERDMTKRYVYVSAGDSQGLQNRNAPSTFVDSFLLHVKEEWPQREGRREMGIKGKKICRKKEQI